MGPVALLHCMQYPHQRTEVWRTQDESLRLLHAYCWNSSLRALLVEFCVPSSVGMTDACTHDQKYINNYLDTKIYAEELQFHILVVCKL